MAVLLLLTNLASLTRDLTKLNPTDPGERSGKKIAFPHKFFRAPKRHSQNLSFRRESYKDLLNFGGAYLAFPKFDFFLTYFSIPKSHLKGIPEICLLGEKVIRIC